MGVAAFGTTVTPTIGEITGISGPGLSRDMIDVTHHTSEDKFREYLGGLSNGGSFSIEGNLTAASNLMSHFSDGDNSESWVITTPANTWSFTGYVENFEPGAPIDGKLGFTASIKVTSTPTLAAV